MNSLRQITVGVRSQAVLVLALSMLWWLSLFQGAIFSFPGLFWVEVGYFCPLVMIVFGAILLISYWRSGRPHKWLVWLAILATASPWIFLLIGFVSSI
jgi:hypothetical protein